MQYRRFQWLFNNILLAENFTAELFKLEIPFSLKVICIAPPHPPHTHIDKRKKKPYLQYCEVALENILKRSH